MVSTRKTLKSIIDTSLKTSYWNETDQKLHETHKELDFKLLTSLLSSSRECEIQKEVLEGQRKNMVEQQALWSSQGMSTHF